MRIKTLTGAVVVALCLLAVGAAGAFAAGPINLREGLELTEGGTPVAAGATLFNEQLVVGHCFVESTGKLLNNKAPIDLISVGAPTHSYCEGGSSSTGGIQGLALMDNGTAVLDSNMTLTTAAGCAYRSFLMEGSFAGDVYVSGSATGYEVRSLSAPGCASELTTEFGVAELSSVTDGLLEYQLVPGGRF